MSKKKAQSGIELIISVVFILLLFIILVLFAIDKTKWSNDLRTLMDAKAVCNSVVDNINMISEAGSGYYHHFSIPTTIYGDNTYNITVDGRRVKIQWDTGSWSAQAVTNNITIYCIDYGLEKQNTVFNRNGKISITCNRPDLMVVGDTFLPKKATANTTFTAKIDVLNFGPVASGPFTILFSDVSKNISVDVPGINADEQATFSVDLNFAVAGNYTIHIWADYKNNVTESLKTDNEYNATIEVR